MHLPYRDSERLANWRTADYPHADYRAIVEILDWLSGRDLGQPPFLRIPRVRALETCWYLRLVEGTPGIFDLYQKLVPSKVELRKTLGPISEAVREYSLHMAEAVGKLDRAFIEGAQGDKAPGEHKRSPRKKRA